jgi:hypothetical protein
MRVAARARANSAAVVGAAAGHAGATLIAHALMAAVADVAIWARPGARSAAAIGRATAFAGAVRRALALAIVAMLADRAVFDVALSTAAIVGATGFAGAVALTVETGTEDALLRRRAVTACARIDAVAVDAD